MATYIDAVQSIAKLRSLPAGWDFGNGVPSSTRSAIGAIRIVQLLHQLGAVDFDVVPGDAGGVTIFGYKGEESVEIQAFSNGTFDFLHESGDNAGNLVSALTISGIAKQLEECGWRSPRLFVSCTHDAMSRGSGDLLDLHSIIPVVVAEYPLSQQTVLPPKEPRFARMFGNSTMSGFRVHRQFSGESKRKVYQTAIA